MELTANEEIVLDLEQMMEEKRVVFANFEDVRESGWDPKWWEHLSKNYGEMEGKTGGRSRILSLDWMRKADYNKLKEIAWQREEWRYCTNVPRKAENRTV